MEILNHMYAWNTKAFLCNQLNPERSRAAVGLKFEPDFLLYSKLRSVSVRFPKQPTLLA